jgi:hypothetical protein
MRQTLRSYILKLIGKLANNCTQQTAHFDNFSVIYDKLLSRQIENETATIANTLKQFSYIKPELNNL